ncbi:hypothetical protein NE865_10130 [Phthorimaea operculella]|nr:hypothetical protein NE865_10130 [Phthorimaea operculella]
MSDDDSLSVGLCDSSSNSDDESKEPEPCVKLKLPENIQAWVTKSELVREEESIPCDSKLAEKVVTNYIIAKKILSYVCWQEKLLCKQVCTTWWSAVNALTRENLHPVDFVYDIHTSKSVEKCPILPFTKSDDLSNEPLAVISFVKESGHRTLKCKDISPSLCKTPCENTKHSVLDVIDQQVCAPKTCMLAVMTSGLMYLPLPNTRTEPFSPDNPNMPTTLFTGVSIPVIPGVNFHVLNMKQKKKGSNVMDLKKDFYEKVDSICQDQIIKGALVFVTEKYILHSVQDIMMLNYLSEMQEDIPFALGGCLIEETLYGDKDMEQLINRINAAQDFVSKNLISIALFTVPKNSEDTEQRDRCNFDMYSTVVLSSEWTKDKVKNAIDQFAKSVPRFEHSVALKLSCVGRDKKHMIEQELFRQAFPNTPLLGCYGNGELGLNHPPRNPPEPPRHKRFKGETQTGRPSLMYSYSTVFVYIGWGKTLPPDPETPKK